MKNIVNEMDALSRALGVESVLRGAALYERVNGNNDGPMYAAYQSAVTVVLARATALIEKSKARGGFVRYSHTGSGRMTTNLDIDRNTVLAHLKAYSVKVAQPGHEFALASGGKSRLYIDAKRTYLHRDMHRPLAALLCDLVKSFGHADAVAGAVLGGCHLASIVAAHGGGGNYNVAFVRKTAKDHGTKNLVEHSWCRFGEWVVLLEDVVSTGKTAERAIAALRADGFKVVGVVAMLDRRPAGEAREVVEGVPLRRLFGLEDLGLEDGIEAIVPPPPERPWDPDGHRDDGTDYG